MSEKNPPASPAPTPEEEKNKPATPPTGLTEEQVQARVEAALAEERKKADATKAKETEERERAEAEKRGEFQKVAEQEQTKREAAEQKAAEAERRAQLAEVNVSLRDHLASKHPDYLSNAADIMLHVEKTLAPDAKPDAVAKLIEEQAKAFVERTPRQKPIGGAPPAPTRGNRIPENLPAKPSGEARRPRWSQMTYRG
jgi:dTMP kinase